MNTASTRRPIRAIALLFTYQAIAVGLGYLT